jgi:hypothetical protein
MVRVMNRVGLVLILAITLLFLISAANGEVAKLDKFNQISPGLGLVQNVSSMTKCSEDDNINIPLYSKNLAAFRIIATHPAYIPTNVNDEGKNCTYCPLECGTWTFFTRYCRECFNKTSNETIYDDGDVVIETVNMIEWRPNAQKMNVSVKGIQYDNVVFFRIYKHIDGIPSWPQVFVLYQDGNARIKPQPSPLHGIDDTTFGSSVIIGATEDLGTQYADIDSVVIDPPNLTMEIKYRDNTSAHIKMQVNRYENIVEVSNITYDTINNSFARLRSMWVKDGNADVDHIRTKDGETHIMGGWKEFDGTWWQLFRKIPSIHNTYCPDIKIEIIPN